MVRRLHGTKKVSGGDNELQVLTYDRMAQGYFSHWFSNHGGAGVYRVSISDNELSTTSLAMAQGKTCTIRGTNDGPGS